MSGSYLQLIIISMYFHAHIWQDLGTEMELVLPLYYGYEDRCEGNAAVIKLDDAGLWKHQPNHCQALWYKTASLIQDRETINIAQIISYFLNNWLLNLLPQV